MKCKKGNAQKTTESAEDLGLITGALASQHDDEAE